MVNTHGTKHLTLRFACVFSQIFVSPGRFFAANELKTMLAHVVVTYDVKLEDDKIHSGGLHTGVRVTPDPAAKVMFRRRA